ncbi:MAG TPA: FliM/FliN family flagellar motor switch protein [Burkholderiaceae bacterium]
MSDTESKQSAPQLIDLPDLPPEAGSGSSIIVNPLDAIEHVKVKLMVRIGNVDLSVGELRDLKEDQVVKLDSLADEPVDIMLEGRIVARGQLVAVDDHFGVRLTEVPKARP